jgi:hypothetical protein
MFSYQPLVLNQPLVSNSTATYMPSLAVFVSNKHENRPDSRSRSVALLARRRPKCPFQAARQRVPTSLQRFLVLRYRKLGGL